MRTLLRLISFATTSVPQTDHWIGTVVVKSFDARFAETSRLFRSLPCSGEFDSLLNHGRTKPCSQAKKQHPATVITAQRLHRSVIDNLDGASKRTLETKPHPAFAKMVWLMQNVSMNHRCVPPTSTTNMSLGIFALHSKVGLAQPNAPESRQTAQQTSYQHVRDSDDPVGVQLV